MIVSISILEMSSQPFPTTFFLSANTTHLLSFKIFFSILKERTTYFLLFLQTINNFPFLLTYLGLQQKSTTQMDQLKVILISDFLPSLQEVLLILNLLRLMLELSLRAFKVTFNW